jgi:putative ABC transport system permease protein
MRIPLRRGRLLDVRDGPDAPLAVLISESLAKQFAGDPIGQRVHVGDTERPWYTIVGVVGDVRQASLALSQPEAVYMTAEQWPYRENARSLVVRGHGDVAELAPAIRNAIWSVDKDQPVVRVATMEDVVAGSAAERRFALIVFQAFGVAALVLAAIGIYGVLSGSVTERAREIGVRSALGASRGNILGLVLRQGMAVTGLGVVIGLSGGAVASQAIVSLLFGVSRLDTITYLGVVLLLLGVSAIACWVPAWRAAQVDPSVTLRAE